MSAFVPALILFPEATDEVCVVYRKQQILCLTEFTVFYNNEDMDKPASGDRYLSAMNGVS